MILLRMETEILTKSPAFQVRLGRAWRLRGFP